MALRGKQIRKATMAAENKETFNYGYILSGVPNADKNEQKAHSYHYSASHAVQPGTDGSMASSFRDHRLTIAINVDDNFTALLAACGDPHPNDAKLKLTHRTNASGKAGLEEAITYDLQNLHVESWDVDANEKGGLPRVTISLVADKSVVTRPNAGGKNATFGRTK